MMKYQVDREKKCCDHWFWNENIAQNRCSCLKSCHGRAKSEAEISLAIAKRGNEILADAHYAPSKASK